MTKIWDEKSLKCKQTIKKRSMSFISHMLPSTAEINIYLHSAGNIFPGTGYILHFISLTNA